MSEKIEGWIPPEEGDLNTEAIKKGLSPKERGYLQRDLESVESGRGSSDANPTAGADNFHKDWEIGNERAEDAATVIEFKAASFQKFLSAKGYTEKQFSYNDIYDYLEYGEVHGDPTVPSEQKREKTKELDNLKTEWQVGLERDEDGRVVYQL
jgi:hypothetical protein